MRYSVVIPAAGQGSRMELGYNKVFYKIGNRTILEKTLAPFIEDKSCVEIILVCSKSDLMKAIDLFTNRKVKTVEGGESREESVYLGLQRVTSDYVLIHDGDRCEFSSDLVARVIKELQEGHTSVIPTISKQNALSLNGRIVGDEVIQTPQGFKTSFILEAFNRCDKEGKLAEFVDDASIGETYLKIKAYHIPGEIKNIKITLQSDLDLIAGE